MKTYVVIGLGRFGTAVALPTRSQIAWGPR